MITEFFHSNPRAEAFGRLNEIMKSGTVRLIGAVCYVTNDGCTLLKANIESSRVPGLSSSQVIMKSAPSGRSTTYADKHPGNSTSTVSPKKGPKPPKATFSRA